MTTVETRQAKIATLEAIRTDRAASHGRKGAAAERIVKLQAELAALAQPDTAGSHAVAAKKAKWIERAACPRAGHPTASDDDLYVVPSSSGNEQCRVCRREIRQVARAAKRRGARS